MSARMRGGPPAEKRYSNTAVGVFSAIGAVAGGIIATGAGGGWGPLALGLVGGAAVVAFVARLFQVKKPPQAQGRRIGRR